MEKLKRNISVCLGFILLQTLQVLSVNADVISESAWTDEEIQYLNQKKNLERIVRDIPEKLAIIEAQAEEGSISDEAYRNAYMLMLKNLLEGHLNVLSTGIELDKSFLRSLKKAGESSGHARKALDKVIQKTRENRMNSQKKFITQSMASIMEQETRRVFGKDSVPFNVRTRLAEFNGLVSGMLSQMENQLKNERAQLLAAGDDFAEIKKIVEGSIEFKVRMSSSLADLTDAVSVLQDVKKMPNINKIFNSVETDTGYMNESVRLLSRLLGGFFNSVFGKDTTLSDSGETNPEPADPDSIRENIKSLL